MDRRRKVVVFLQFLQLAMLVLTGWVRQEIVETANRKRKRNSTPKYLIPDKICGQRNFLERLTQGNNRDCFHNLMMHKTAFNELCTVLRVEGGFRDDQYVSVNEKTAIFLRTLSHHQKNRTLQTDFQRSGQTISVAFHEVLNTTVKLKDRFLARAKPVYMECTDRRWSCFQGCLGALDGTYIPIHAPTEDHLRYRTPKGTLATNVLGVCDTKGRFVYMLAGWEGSAADARVLRDALSRTSSLKVPHGCYYLCDGGYMNCDGFLTPYISTRYHLEEWGPGSRRPQNLHELFNLKHASARNTIECAFGILKKRFAVLRSPTFFPLRKQRF